MFARVCLALVVVASSSLPLVNWAQASGESHAEPWIEVASLSGHRDTVKSLAFHSKSGQLISASFDGVVKVWDVATCKEARSFTAHPGRLGGFAISRDGLRFATGDYGGVVKLWDASTWQNTTKLAHEGAIYSLAFSPDGTRLATAGKRIVHIWDVASGKKSTQIEAGFWPIKGLALTHDGKRVVVAGFDCFTRVLSPTAGGILRVYDLTDGKQLAEAKTERPITAIRLANDDAVIAADMTGCLRYRLVVRDGEVKLELIDEFRKIVEDHGAKLSPEQFTAVDVDGPNRCYVVAAASPGPMFPHSGHVRVFESERGTPVALLAPRRDAEPEAVDGAFGLQAVAISADGQWIAGGGQSGLITLWKRGDGGAADSPVTVNLETPRRSPADRSGAAIDFAAGGATFDQRRLALIQAIQQQQRDQFLQIMPGIENVQERQAILLDVHPRNGHFIDRLLELAAVTSEPDTRFDALALAMYLCRQPSLENLHARRAAVIDQLLVHHLQDPELSRVFYLLAQMPGDDVETLLRRAAKEAADAGVRGHAHWALGELLCRKAALARAMRSVDERDRANAALWKGLDAALVAEHASADPNQLRAQGEAELELVVREFGQVIKRPDTFSRLDDPLQPRLSNWKPMSLGELAQRALFALRRISVGQQAPEIEGRDAAGGAFKLSDYRGKVVLLVFSGDWCSACVKRYPEYRQLVGQFRDRPFAVLQVNSDSSLESLKQSVSDGKIAWTCWWDGPPPDGPIASAWQVEAWPAVYLLDHEGVIRRQNIFGDPLQKAIAELVAKIEVR